MITPKQIERYEERIAESSKIEEPTQEEVPT
jgi:hypothetical protein